MSIALAPGLKLRRADYHLREFRKGFDEWLALKPYYVEAHQQPESDEVVLIGRVRNTPPAIEWGVMIGDVIHNLRSALDSLVWTFSVWKSGPAPSDPLPRNDPWRKIKFPIVQESGQWQSAVKGCLWAVDPSLLAEFKGSQPFVTGKHAPEREPLTVLHELWNIDKHRHPNLTSAFVEIKSIAGYTPEDAAFSVVSLKPPGPFEDGAELARIVWAGLGTPAEKVNMQAYAVFDVSFDQGPPAYGEPLFPMLERLCEEVAQIMARFLGELSQIPPNFNG